jgi:hypothetical protein
MNRTSALALILISLTALCTVGIALVWASGDSWAPKASMNEARGGLGVAVVNGKLKPMERNIVIIFHRLPT